MGAGKWTPGFWKSRQCSYPLGHLSSPRVALSRAASIYSICSSRPWPFLSDHTRVPRQCSMSEECPELSWGHKQQHFAIQVRFVQKRVSCRHKMAEGFFLSSPTFLVSDLKGRQIQIVLNKCFFNMRSLCVSSKSKY